MITYTPSKNLNKFNVKLDSLEEFVAPNRSIQMPLGLIGFENIKLFDIFYAQDELPFMHLKSVEDQPLQFVVVEPFGLVNDYQIEIMDLDLDFLKIKKIEDAFILNIVTVKNGEAETHATVNLVGPIVINRHTYIGKQIVIGNYKKYSANYLLF